MSKQRKTENTITVDRQAAIDLLKSWYESKDGFIDEVAWGKDSDRAHRALEDDLTGRLRKFGLTREDLGLAR